MPSSGFVLRAIAQDLFNRADGDPGTNWIIPAGSVFAKLAISTNAVRDSSSVDGVLGMMLYDPLGFPDNQWSQAKVKACNGADDSVGVGVRWSKTADTGYRFAVNGPLGAGAPTAIRRVVATVDTGLTSGTATVNADDLLRLEVEGTTLKAFVNDTEVLSTVDTQIAAGAPSIEAFVTGSLTDTSLDDWSAGGFAQMPKGFPDFPKFFMQPPRLITEGRLL